MLPLLFLLPPATTTLVTGATSVTVILLLSLSLPFIVLKGRRGHDRQTPSHSASTSSPSPSQPSSPSSPTTPPLPSTPSRTSSFFSNLRLPLRRTWSAPQPSTYPPPSPSDADTTDYSASTTKHNAKPLTSTSPNLKPTPYRAASISTSTYSSTSISSPSGSLTPSPNSPLVQTPGSWPWPEELVDSPYPYAYPAYFTTSPLEHDSPKQYFPPIASTHNHNLANLPEEQVHEEEAGHQSDTSEESYVRFGRGMTFVERKVGGGVVVSLDAADGGMNGYGQEGESAGDKKGGSTAGSKGDRYNPRRERERGGLGGK